LLVDSQSKKCFSFNAKGGHQSGWMD
jgi:hypothetical protein